MKLAQWGKIEMKMHFVPEFFSIFLRIKLPYAEGCDDRDSLNLQLVKKEEQFHP